MTSLCLQPLGLGGRLLSLLRDGGLAQGLGRVFPVRLRRMRSSAGRAVSGAAGQRRGARHGLTGRGAQGGDGEGLVTMRPRGPSDLC